MSELGAPKNSKLNDWMDYALKLEDINATLESEQESLEEKITDLESDVDEYRSIVKELEEELECQNVLRNKENCAFGDVKTCYFSSECPCNHWNSK